MLITAPLIHNGKKFLPSGHLLEVDEKGIIVGMYDFPPIDKAITNYEEGTLCPGFVNAHCHLELSHLKGVIPKHTGLVSFLKEVMQTRFHFTEEEKTNSRLQATQELISNGVVAVGDIANTTDTLHVRANKELAIHTFIECLGFLPSQAANRYYDALKTYETFRQNNNHQNRHSQSLSPHAPYSLSTELLTLIAQHPSLPLTLHNQESKEEELYYKNKKGGFSSFFKDLGIDDAFFQPSGKSSLQTLLPFMNKDKPTLLVHNTFSEEEDVIAAHKTLEHVYWCLCPNANLYIENKLPDVSMLLRNDAQICMGTDSLASNDELSILSELNTIGKAFPEIGWAQLLRFATYNGAKALMINDNYGSLEIGKKPGILHLLPSNNLVKRII